MSVLITGASGGLGGAVCDGFVQSGAKVIGVDRSAKDSKPYLTIAADVMTAAGCEAMVKQALAHGPIDAVVHLVGGFSPGTIAATSEQVWDLMMGVNAKTAFNVMRASLPSMIAAKRGRIVAVGSRAAVEASPGFSAYAVSKAALVALVKNAAAEVKDSGITVNAVLPSTIDTPANRKAMAGADFSTWIAPESIAQLIVWLCSDAAANVSGAAIPIYGRA
ncbi:MAG TPA: SDR family NAD(P)-dependent oxidoreductase [Bryobacteraceae bacterium]|nr:SDR family NAD(P)-dependent oxidoreductase [Bryobacteraceae bacterium]